MAAEARTFERGQDVHRTVRMERRIGDDELFRRTESAVLATGHKTSRGVYIAWRTAVDVGAGHIGVAKLTSIAIRNVVGVSTSVPGRGGTVGESCRKRVARAAGTSETAGSVPRKRGSVADVSVDDFVENRLAVAALKVVLESTGRKAVTADIRTSLVRGVEGGRGEPNSVSRARRIEHETTSNLVTSCTGDAGSEWWSQGVFVVRTGGGTFRIAIEAIGMILGQCL